MSASMSVLAVAMFAVAAGGNSVPAARATVPVLYSTDLYHPYGDPDDHFDLATLFALEEFDLRGIILDGGARQQKAPGRIPLEQMMHMTGRRVPYAIGLGRPLRAPGDDGRDQDARFQKGVELILDVLRRSPARVTVMTTGSVRDVAAAWNRDPDLLRRKIARLYINIGDSGTGLEHNVTLDAHSYAAVLRSGLPVYWCPCFDKGDVNRERGYATYWQFRQEDALASAPGMLQNWFIFALTKPPGVDPTAFLSAPQDAAARDRVWAMRRNMWCTGPLLHAAGREVVEAGPDRWVAVPAGKATTAPKTPHAFVPARVAVDDDGRTTLILADAAPDKPAGQAVHVFKVVDPARYAKIMTSCLRDLFAGLPTSEGGKRQAGQ